ncbi:hypothetical protein [Mycobacterium deserti]|uniref:Uncharacterized protein n=1 Tax=Mycobacterium deserti TaxID=2978347 RepID=A0ABT2MAL0_9MYCO|nr:hypothetical protein [Mycobacterium deserti]MCT7658036.1 hypothetical protein [Mycobacterium deserti]
MIPPSEQEWAQIDRHTYAANAPGGAVRLPPYSLILTLRTLVGTADNIVASHTLLSPEPDTVWKLWAFSVDSIAFVEAKYETDNYDYGEDDQRRQGRGLGNPVEPALTTAWSRPVSTVTAFEIVAVRYISRNREFGRGTSEFYPTVIKIAFTDETSTVVNVERSLDDESKRPRWEAFVTAARQAAT